MAAVRAAGQGAPAGERRPQVLGVLAQGQRRRQRRVDGELRGARHSRPVVLDAVPGDGPLRWDRDPAVQGDRQAEHRRQGDNRHHPPGRQRGPDVAGALGDDRQAAGAQGGLRPDPGRLPARVTATDMAGNKQVRVGTTRLTVR